MIENNQEAPSGSGTNKADSDKGSSKRLLKSKEFRNMEQQLFKSHANLTAEEKLEIVSQKYAELLGENKSAQTSLKNSERHLQLLLKEKEQLQNENGKLLLARSRLEEVARELQRQNKTIKEECTLRIREEEEKRKEVSAKFQATLSEVSALLQQNNEKNSKLREENVEMAGKLQVLCDQYAIREEHLGKLGEQYDIERQLNEAKLAKIRMESAEMKEKMLQDKQKLLLELTEYQKKCQTMQQEEISLRQQLSMYTGKYDEFQQALAASNRTFAGFKEQMDAMTKKLKNLEKETASWKQRWEKSNNCLLEMATEKKKADLNLSNATKNLSQMERLCRALQTERIGLLQKLKEQDASSALKIDVQMLNLQEDLPTTNETSGDCSTKSACGNLDATSDSFSVSESSQFTKPSSADPQEAPPKAEP